MFFYNICYYTGNNGQGKGYDRHFADVSIAPVIETSANCRSYRFPWPLFSL